MQNRRQLLRALTAVFVAVRLRRLRLLVSPTSMEKDEVMTRILR